MNGKTKAKAKEETPKETYGARQAFEDGVLTGAMAYASAVKSPVRPGENAIIDTIMESTEEISDAFETCRNKREGADWRIGNWVSPGNEYHILHHGWKHGYYKYYVEAVRPSGTAGIECPHGVLEISAWSRRGRLPKHYLVPADEWVVA